MTDVRVTQGAVEVLAEPTRPTARVTQGAVEVLVDPARPSVRLTQCSIEILRATNDASARRPTLILTNYLHVA